MTWLLILVIAGSPVLVHGYANKDECENSATHAQRRGVGLKITGWVCLPERTEPAR